MALITAALIVGGSALNAKIAKNRANNPQDTVTARAAGMTGGTGGEPIEITPVEASGAEGITPFEYKGGADNNNQAITEEELMAILNQMSPEEAGGIMSAATGRYLSRAKGGGISPELLEFLMPDKFTPNQKFNSIEEMIAANKPPIDEIVASASRSDAISKPDMPEQQVGIASLDVNPNIGVEMPREMTMKESVESFAGKNPAVFNALVSTLGDLIASSINKPKDPPAQLDSRPMVAGNANRRSIQFKPIGAQSGGVLNRPMFMPHGGAMRGPGGPKDDVIPVMASNGEFMLSKAAVDQAGGGNHRLGIAKLNAFNNKGNRRYG